MSRGHAKGFLQAGCRIVALADVRRDNAELFQKDVGGDAIYDDYRAMLAQEKPDVVSISTGPRLHAEMVVASAEAGVRAIHCEKPLALTFGDARRMVQVCADRNVQLTFNHQRRFNAPFVKARDLVRAGRIGTLRLIEMECPNLFDWGSHWFDMMFFYNDQAPAEWVIGQIDMRGTKDIFAAPCEGQGLSHVKFANDVRATMTTGFGAKIGASHRLHGTEGQIEIASADGNHLRLWGKGETDWQTIPTEEGIHGMEAVTRGVLDLVDALAHGREPELSGRKALMATELIFATYESSRRRGRADLPLTIDDSPLMDMLGRA
jgi:UDP-N-acetylglucosamine 3-dehydrogenase